MHFFALVLAIVMVVVAFAPAACDAFWGARKGIKQSEMYILVNLHKHSWKRRDDVGEIRRYELRVRSCNSS